MRTATILSGVLHVTLFLIAVFGLPSPDQRLVMAPEPIPVDIVDISELTNTRIDEPKPEPPKPEPPKPAPTVPQEQPPPPPPEAQAEPEPPPPMKEPEPPKVAEVPPEPKPVEPEPKPELKKLAELPKPKEPETKPLEPPKPLPKKEPPKKEEPKKQELASVLQNVLKMKDPAEKQEKTEEKAEPQRPTSEAPSRSDRLSLSEEDALRRQITQCWNVDPGAKGVQEMSAEFRVFFDDGFQVEKVEYLRGSGSTSDPSFRSFVESARRALLVPKCSKLNLPADRAGERSIVINFSPRDMF
ncbi:MAG TPA: energy transducer TonB [Azospirillaceae bacterium]|nr:energy transducer TonB [Azospirillaceae bacterium]